MCFFDSRFGFFGPSLGEHDGERVAVKIEKEKKEL